MKRLIYIISLFSIISYGQNNIIIGDSQTYYLAKHTQIITLIKPLTQSGIGVNQLNNKVITYPISENVNSVSVCIGVNDYYRDKGIERLMNSIKRTFPNATIYVIQGSWGWGGVKKYSSLTLMNYYNKFKNLGGIVIESPIGKGNPHKDKKIYKKIANNICDLIIK